MEDWEEALANFDNTITLCKCREYPWQCGFESNQQGLLATIANPNPNQSPDVIRTVCQVKEIFVLAEDDKFAGDGSLPQFDIRRFIQTQFQDVLGRMSLFDEKSRECAGKLVVHQKVHAP